MGLRGNLGGASPTSHSYFTDQRTMADTIGKILDRILYRDLTCFLGGSVVLAVVLAVLGWFPDPGNLPPISVQLFAALGAYAVGYIAPEVFRAIRLMGTGPRRPLLLGWVWYWISLTAGKAYSLWADKNTWTTEAIHTCVDSHHPEVKGRIARISDLRHLFGVVGANLIASAVMIRLTQPHIHLGEAEITSWPAGTFMVFAILGAILFILGEIKHYQQTRLERYCRLKCETCTRRSNLRTV